MFMRLYLLLSLSLTINSLIAMDGGGGRVKTVGIDLDMFDFTPFKQITHTSLAHALNNKEWELAEKLINNGADIHEPICGELYTPLHLAVLWKQKNLVQLLLEKSANVEAKNIHGETPLQVSSIELGQKWPIFKLLLEHGASILASTKNTIYIDTLYEVNKKIAVQFVFEAFRYAIEHNNEQRFKELLSHKSPAIKKGILMSNEQGKTLFDFMDLQTPWMQHAAEDLAALINEVKK